MPGDLFGLDLGSILPYVVESIKEIFNQDEHTKSLIETIHNRAKRSYNDASRILIAGMAEAMGLKEAYQAQHLAKSQDGSELTPIDDVIMQPGNSTILFGMPGRWKIYRFTTRLYVSCEPAGKFATTLFA